MIKFCIFAEHKIMGYRPLVEKFAQRVVTTAVNVVAKVGFFFNSMKILNLDIYISANNCIALKQGDDTTEKMEQFVLLTPDMVKLVCDELKKLKNELQNERLD